MNHLDAQFYVDENRCIGCGQCVKVCPGAVLHVNDKGKAEMQEFEAFGWNGCWKCEHCLAVCPKEAISIFGHKPENSLPPVEEALSARTMDALVQNRHTCRRYRQQNLPTTEIAHVLSLLAAAPNGGNKQQVEFTLIDDIKQTERFRATVYQEMERLAGLGIYPEGFDQPSYEDMKRWQETVRPDMLFCGAPHLLIPHAPLGRGEPRQDVMIAGTYFELLASARGWGVSLLTFPLDVLNTMPQIKAQLQIPEDHYIGMVIGFGLPEIRYRRGVQRDLDPARIHLPFAEATHLLPDSRGG